MKKCPYCAEEIQDEAIFCRYCRRDLPTKEPEAPAELQPQAQLPAQQETLMEPARPAIAAQSSVWKSGAKGSAVITAIYTINHLFLTPTFMGDLVFGIPATFFVWWLICTGIVWVWRTFDHTSVALVCIGIVVVIIALTSWNARTTSNPVATPRPTQRPTTRPVVIPTATNVSCFHWSQIDTSMIGHEVCVYGDVISMEQSEGIATRFEFSTEKNSFALISSQYSYFDVVHKGDCVQVVDVVLSRDDLLYMSIGDTIYRCPP